MRTIALMLPRLNGGGAERMMLQLAGGLARLGYRVDLVVAVLKGPYIAELPANVRMVNLGLRRRPYRLALIPLVVYLLRTRPAVLITALFEADMLALLATLPWRWLTPVVLTFRVDPGTQPGGHYRSWLHWEICRRVYPLAKGYIAVSEGVRQAHVFGMGLPSQRLITVYNPTLRPEINQLAAQPLDHPWFAAGQPPVILAVGRLEMQKRFDLLIRALAGVRRSREARLVILGQGPLLQDLKELAAELGVEEAVDFPGFDLNPFRYMRHAVVLALTSDQEGLPNVLIEALYCGLPVVSTDCPSGPKEVLQGGRWGQLVAPGDLAELVQALETTLSRGRVIHEDYPGALAAHLRQFTVEYATQAYLAALRQLGIRLPDLPADGTERI
jgi:glycosyltransferase involved in cell wall biosynthesis